MFGHQGFCMVRAHGSLWSMIRRQRGAAARVLIETLHCANARIRNARKQRKMAA